MAEKTYLDNYDTPEEKTKALISNLEALILFKGYTVDEFDKKLFGRKYIQPCKHFGTIEFSRLMAYCDKLGVTIPKLMTFSYENIAKKAELEAKIERRKQLESELAKLKMQIDLDQKSLNEAYRQANLQKMK